MGWRDVVFQKGSEAAGKKPSAVGTSSPNHPTATPTERSSYLGDSSRTRGRTASIGATPQSTPITVDAQFDTELKATLDRAATPGYQEFSAQMEVLADVVPDESTRIQKALMSVNRMLHIGVPQIVASIQERLDLLNQEKAKFENELRNEIREHVDSNTKALDDLKTALVKNETELARLKAEQTRLAQEEQAARNAVQKVQGEGEQVRARFNSAYQPLQSSLTSVLAKIQPHS